MEAMRDGGAGFAREAVVLISSLRAETGDTITWAEKIPPCGSLRFRGDLFLTSKRLILTMSGIAETLRKAAFRGQREHPKFDRGRG